MEYVAGPSLAALLADGPMSPAPAMDVIVGTAAGLAGKQDPGPVGSPGTRPGNGKGGDQASPVGYAIGR